MLKANPTLCRPCMKHIFAVYFLLTININALARQADDTLAASKAIQEIEVIGSRILTSSAMNFSPVSVIGNDKISSLAPIQISDILSISPGVAVKDYGGLGGIKTVAVRGLGSSRTLILLDGMPISSTQNSSYNLGDLPVPVIDNIEIMRGGASAIFGGNAVGGAVNIRTDLIPQNMLKASILAGSFGELGVNLTGSIPVSSSYISGSVNYLASNGDYPFTCNQFGEDVTAKRQNADYANLSLSMLGKTNIGDWNLWGRGIYSSIDKGIPGAVLQGNVSQSNDRMDEKKFIFLLHTGKLLSDSSSIFFSGIAMSNNSSYLEPQKTSQPNSDFRLKDFGINSKYTFHAANFYNEILANAFYSTLSGSMLDPDVDSNVHRTTLAASYRIEKNFDFGAQQLAANAGVRVDYISDSYSAFSALAGAIYSISGFPVRAKTSFSHNFRPPNFNEMYYRNYGNKNLKPEKSNSFNLGMQYSMMDYLFFEVEGFYLPVEDMIVSMPKTPISWTAQNLDKAVSSGLEFSLSLIDEFLFINSFNLSYTLQKTIDKSGDEKTYNKQLPYTPNELITIFYKMDLANIDFGFKCDYSSFRYTQPDNDSRAILPSYFTIDAFIYKKFIFSRLNLTFRFDCKNLLDERYAIISNYIMPGRTFTLTCNINY